MYIALQNYLNKITHLDDHVYREPNNHTVSDEVCDHRKLWLAYINGGTFENFVPGTRFSGHLVFAPCYTIDVTCSSK